MGGVSRVWRTAATWCLCVVGVLMAAGPAVAQDDYDVALGLYQKERWADAAAGFERYIKANPRSEQLESALLYAGFAEVNSGQYAAARDNFEQFVKDFPNSEHHAEALYRLGETSYTLGDYQRAAQELTAFLDGFPKHKLREWALPYLADAELHLKQLAEAEKHFRAALSEFPQAPLASEAEYGLAKTLEAQGRRKEALDAFAKIAAGGGQRAAASLKRIATIYYDEGQFETAGRAFRDLVERFPQSKFVPSAWLNAGFSAYQAGDFNAAVASLSQATQWASNAPRAYHWIGMARKRQGDYQQAAEAFETVLTDYPQSDYAGESRFQWADAALRHGQTKKALELFEKIAGQKPPGEHTAAAVYFAGGAALALGDLARARELVERFEADFADSPYRIHARLLAGKVLEQRSRQEGVSEQEQAALEKEALAKYARVIEETEVASSAAKARFQIARLRSRRGEYEKSLKAVGPLLDKIGKVGAKSPHLDALVLAAEDYLGLEQFDKAIAAASEYWKLAPEGPRAVDALAARAAARLETGETAEAHADWEQLKKSASGDQTTLLPIARSLAERAYANEQWAAAADLFRDFVKLAGDNPEGADGLSGLGWSLQKAGDYGKAAEAFGKLVEKYPQAPRLAPEAAYMKGKSLQDAGDLEAAVNAYRKAFETFAAAKPAPPGAEAEGKARNVYLSGLQLARVLRSVGKIEDSDAAYAALVEAFPQPQSLDKLLEEWALLHYEAGDFGKADALFKRMLEETPESPRAAAARLSLAESAMIAGKNKEAAAKAKTIISNKKAPEKTRARARSLLVRLAADQNQWQQVLELTGRYLQDYPAGSDRPAMMYLRGEALLQTGQGDEAKELLTKVAALSEESSIEQAEWFGRVLLLLAESAFQEKDYDAAQKWLDEFAALKPAPDYAFTVDELRGRIFKQQAKFDKARQAYQKVLDAKSAERTETAARSQYGIAQTYFLQREWAKARKEALAVYALYKIPEWQAPALLMVGLTDELMGNPQKAIETFRDVTKEFPNSDAAKTAAKKLTTLGKAE